MSIPVGAITLTVSGVIPPGSLECDGRPVDRNRYNGLYSVIGAIFGEDTEANTFNLPGPFDLELFHGLIAVIKY